MSQSYLNLLGAPPDARTPAWDAWRASYVSARLAAAPLARATTYYFAQSGNDSTGAGTQASPWKSISKAQAVLNAAGGAGVSVNVALLFNRGDTWSETTGLSVSQNNVTVADYGTGAQPFFNLFTVKYASSGWTQNGTTDEWTRTETNDIAWVRDQANRLTPYQRVTSSALVQSTPGSFWYDSTGTTLHINVGTGVSPNAKNLEAVISNANSGVAVSGDGVRVQNLRADGWGCHRTTTATQAQPFSSNTSGTNAALFIACAGFYSGSHVMAHYQGSGAGGISLWIDCIAGFAKYNGANGETIFNSYSNTGGNETVWINCVAAYGTLPSSDWVTAAITCRGRAFFAHTGSSTLALLLSYNCQIPANTWPCQQNAATSAPPPVSTITDCRCFVVGETQGYTLAGGQGNAFGVAGMVQRDCSWNLYPNNIATSGGLMGVGYCGDGWVVNCTLQMNLAAQTWYTGLWVNRTNATCQILHSTIYVYGLVSGYTFSLDENGNTATGVSVINSILSGGRTDGGLMKWSAVLAGATLKNNAYFGQSSASNYSADANPVVLLDPPIIGDVPTPASLLYQAGATTAGVPMDATGRPRRPSAAPSIGPLETFQGSIGISRGRLAA